MIWRFWKCASMLKLPWKREFGTPQASPGFGLPEATSLGIAPRGKNQILMKSEVHSVAYTPPLAALNPEPNVRLWESAIWHPALVPWLGALISQFGVTSSPEKSLPFCTETPALV